MPFAYVNVKDKINTELSEFNEKLHNINIILKQNTCNCDRNHLRPLRNIHITNSNNKTTKQIEKLSNFLNGNLKQKQNPIIAKYSED